MVGLSLLASCERRPSDVSAIVTKENKKESDVPPSSDGRGATPANPRHVFFLKHDFGCVEPNVTSTCELVLRNDKECSLSFDSWVPACGCISCTRMPKSIAPSEQGTFVITLDTTGKRGMTKERIAFSSKRNSVC